MDQKHELIAAAFTPMDQNDRIDYGKINTLAQLYQNNGVDGVFIAGTTGESASLALEEKKQLMIHWGKQTSSSLQKIFLLGGTRLPDIQYLAQMAADHNMDALSVICPYYFKPADVEQLAHFCSLAAQAAPNLPFYYYHIPGMSGGHFSMPTFLKLAEERIPNLAGIKFSSPNLMDFHACCIYQNGKYKMYWGSDEVLLSGLAVGAAGGIGSTYNYAAPLYRKIIAALKDGRLQEAEKWQRSAVKMVGILIKYGGICAGKAFMKLIGVDCGWSRPPVDRLSDQALKNMKKELEEIAFFDFCSVLPTETSGK